METDILAHPARLLSNALILLCLFTSCQKVKSLHRMVVNADHLNWVNKGKLKLYDGTPFTGMVFKLDTLSGDTLYIENYQLGLKHGSFKRFYPNQLLFEKREYRQGKKEGLHLGYWDNGMLAFEYHLENDIYHGSLTSWNSKGQIIKSLHYTHGQQSGHQQLWDDNGAIRTNYIIKNNRRYGLLGTKNCINVSDSIQ
jgi:antitoxin component YwqK of YwqJK toxin-antitoxin module